MRTSTILSIVALLFIPITGEAANSSIFQYSLPVESTRIDKKTHTKKVKEVDAFLWIPPESSQVRGVIVGGKTLMEGLLVRDPNIRRVCAEQDLALLYIKAGLNSIDLPKILEAFARKSGYHELQVAPLMFVGHSAGGPQARDMAAKYADRCFGLIQYRGGAPGHPDTPVPPGIPCLAMFGQFDEFWGTMRNREGEESWQRALEWIKGYRSSDPGNLVTFLVEPGAGHFGWSAKNSAYVARFITKAAEAKIPESWDPNSKAPIVLKPIDPIGGWLGDLPNLNPGVIKAAPANQYVGNTEAANWHFDEEMAQATIEYHKGLTGLEDQFLEWKDPYWLDAGARYYFTKPQWVDAEGTLRVHPAYSDSYPVQVNGQGPKWAKAGEPVNNSGSTIHVVPVRGPLKATEKGELKYAPNSLDGHSLSKASFMAMVPANSKYRYTEHVGLLNRGYKGLSKGKTQEITFPKITDRPANSSPIELTATSSAGLPVSYFVAHGPAVVEGQTLSFKEIPKRAEFPIEIKVVAYQFGNPIDPQVRTATPVSQRLHLTAAPQ